MAVQSNRQVHAPGQFLAPTGRERQAVLDLVVRRRNHILVGVKERTVPVVRSRNRTRHRLYVLGVRVCIATAEVDAVLELFLDAERECQRLRFPVAVGQPEAWHTNAVVDRVAVRVGANLLEIAVLDHGRVLGLGEQQVCAEYPVVVHHMGDAKGELELTRDLEARIKVVDFEIAARASRYIVMDRLRDTPAGTLRNACFTINPGFRGQIPVGPVGAELTRVVVRVHVRQPDIRVAARVDAQTTVEDGAVGEVERKANARLRQALTVEGEVVAKTVLGQELLVQRRRIAGRVPVMTQAGYDRQTVADLELVLDVHRVDVVTPIRCRVIRVVGRRIVVVDVVGELGFKGFQRRETETTLCAEAQLGLGVLDEDVEDFQRLELITEGQAVIIEIVHATQCQRRHVVVHLV